MQLQIKARSLNLMSESQSSVSIYIIASITAFRSEYHLVSEYYCPSSHGYKNLEVPEKLYKLLLIHCVFIKCQLWVRH